jgi:folate-binding protein YgfZ
MTSSLVWADIPRDVVVVEGDDAATFLHSQLAQDIAPLAVGHSVHSLLLEPTGHVHSIVRVVRHSDTVFTLDVDSPHGESLIPRLQRFVLRSKVTLRANDWVVRAFRGDGAENEVGAGTNRAVVAWGGGGAVDVIAPIEDQPVHGEQTEPEHIDMIRVDGEWPRLGVDVLVGDIPASTGIVRVAVSFTKGCYPGQELVERMDSRGAGAPVNIRVVDRDGVGVGSRIEVSPHDTGTVTSIGFSRALVRVGRNSAIGREPGAHR